MKKVLSLMFIVATTLSTSCKKSTDIQSPVSSLQLTATKVTNIHRKEPLTFTVNSLSTASVTWSVVPPKGVWYSRSGNKAFMRFNNAGSYKVYAAAGNNLDSTIIIIDSTIFTGDTTLPGTVIPMDTIVYHNPIDSTNIPVDSTHHDSTVINNHDTTISLFGDQLQITPQVYLDSMAPYSPTLVLTTTTSKTYPSAFPQLQDSVITFTNRNLVTGYQIVYSNVLLPGGVTSSNAKAAKNDYYAGLADGTYRFSVIFNAVSYSGSFIKSGNTFTFNWQNTGSVIISPLTVTK